MGLYGRVVLPRLLDKAMSGPEMDLLRKEALAPSRGRVLEIGFGTGLNVPHYPQGIESLAALDPNPGMEARARERLGTASFPVEFQRGSGEALPYPDGAFETVVTTFVLCSLGDAPRALGEIRRVLAPGGRYVLLEHGLSKEPSVQKWQHRLNGFNKLLLGNCHLNRPIRALVAKAGFHFETIGESYNTVAPKFAGWTTRGCAAPWRRPQLPAERQAVAGLKVRL
jgi:ubiquinone/menaquinone biosynthesis C-methylase UbiE